MLSFPFLSYPLISSPHLQGYTLFAGTATSPYLITLTPQQSLGQKKIWRFRCDTLKEFELWLQILSEIFLAFNKDDK